MQSCSPSLFWWRLFFGFDDSQVSRRPMSITVLGDSFYYHERLPAISPPSTLFSTGFHGQRRDSCEFNGVEDETLSSKKNYFVSYIYLKSFFYSLKAEKQFLGGSRSWMSIFYYLCMLAVGFILVGDCNIVEGWKFGFFMYLLSYPFQFIFFKSFFGNLIKIIPMIFKIIRWLVSCIAIYTIKLILWLDPINVD